LEKLFKEMKNRLSAKEIVFRAHQNMWWDKLLEKYQLTEDQLMTGMHTDISGMALRKGVLSR